MMPLATAVALSLLPAAARHAAALALDRMTPGAARRGPEVDGPGVESGPSPLEGRDGGSPSIGPPLSALLRAIGVGPAEAPARARALAVAARAALERGSARGLTALPRGDRAYPPRLAVLPDPPFVLWVRGRADLLCRPAVAIVGTRRASPASLALARSLARDLASRGLVVVSGLARGIDAAAHEGALEAGTGGAGSTVAIVGCGADIVYPREHAELHERIGRGGAIASEFPPGTPARRFHFPIRNRLVSGLAIGVVVIEAPERSGALITAACALDQGREVMVVPGPARSERFRGSHALIRDGAALVEEAADVLAVLGWRTGEMQGGARTAGPAGAADSGRTGPAAAGRSNPLADGEGTRSGPESTGGDPGRPADGSREAAAEAALLSWRPGVERDLDELIEVMGMGAPAALARLAEWELWGLVGRTAAGRFVRLPG